MDFEQQAGKNFAWLSIAQIGIRVLGAAFFIFLTYKLNDTGIGQYSFISSFVPFWFIVIDFGGGEYLYREWARGKSKDSVEYDFFVLFTARLIITSAVFIAFAATNYFINRGVLLSLVLFYFSMFFAMFTHLAELYLQSVNAFKFVAFRQILEKVAAIVCGVILLLLWPRLEMVFVAILFSQIVSIGYYYFKVLPFRFRLVFNWQRTKELFIRGLPFLFIGIFVSLYARIDMVMLRYFGSFEAVGWYGTAYKFIDLAFLFPSLFVASIFPIISSLYNNPAAGEQFSQFFRKSLRILFSAGLMVAVFFIAFAPQIIAWFFPASFGPSALALRILIIGLALGYLSALFNSMLLVQKKEKIGLYIIIFCALLNIGLNFILIPKYSIYGAAWATVISELFNLFLLQHFLSWKKEKVVLGKMLFLVALNAALLGVLKFTGQINNIILDGLLLLTNLLILFTVKLLEIGDIKLFLRPIAEKLGYFKQSYLS